MMNSIEALTYSFYWFLGVLKGFLRVISFVKMLVLQNRVDTETSATTVIQEQKFEIVQPELYKFENHYDIILTNSPNGDWYRWLKNFQFQQYQKIGAEYYDSLYNFNQTANAKILQRQRNNETKEQAELRLLFDRPTMQENLKDSAVIFSSQPKVPGKLTVNIDEVRPGKTPDRARGKKPKDFFPLVKAFLGAVMMGYPPEPKEVQRLLTTNLLFLEECGFIPKFTFDKYSFKHAPSLRKLEQFDQIMTEYGLWEKMKIQNVSDNLKDGIIKSEDKIVGDTTHYYAYSGFETLEYTDENGKSKRKSQSKTTKKCNCKNKETCSHEWVLVDDGAGTIVKSASKIYWGHKASIIGFPGQGIALDAVPIADASTHDGKTIFPHVEKLFATYPVVKETVKTILYDSAADDAQLKIKFKEELNVDLRTSINPRTRKDVTTNLPRGIAKITPFGYVICMDEKEMEYQGIRYELEKYIFSAPLLEDGTIACQKCNNKSECCPNAEKGRVAVIAFDLMPFIDPSDPPMAKRFKAMMKLRPSVERMIKTLKCDLADSRLSKQGNLSFKAYLDKTMIAYHQLLRMK